MGGPRDCHTEYSKSDREREILYDIAYMRNLKNNDTNELIYKFICKGGRMWGWRDEGSQVLSSGARWGSISTPSLK